MSEWPRVIPNDDGIRPAGSPDKCFYCERKVGQEHGRECVTISKRVRVRYVFETEVLIPHSWSSEHFEWHRTSGSWCADNAFDEFTNGDASTCCCNALISAAVVEIVDPGPIQPSPYVDDYTRQ